MIFIVIWCKKALCSNIRSDPSSGCSEFVGGSNLQMQHVH